METRFAGFSSQDEKQIYEFLSQDSSSNLAALSRLENFGTRDFLGWFAGNSLVSIFVLGANLMPIRTTSQSRDQFARNFAAQGRRCVSIVGEQEQVLDLWRRLEPSWGSARAIRESQPYLKLMANMHQPTAVPNLEVGLANLADFDDLLPASIEMFTEELGVSPVIDGADLAYRMRIKTQIENGQIFVGRLGNELVFKVEIGALADSKALIQGVWVKSTYRGRGLGTSALGIVFAQLFGMGIAEVCLYVNDFNTPALRLYQRLGMTQHKSFATVLF